MDRIPTIYRNLEWAKTIANFEDVAFRISNMNLARNEKVMIVNYAERIIESKDFTAEEVKKLEIEFRSML